MSSTDKLENPQNLPVEALELTISNNGIIQKVKALDPYWVDTRLVSMYEPPPTGTNLVFGATQAWKHKMEWYLHDLNWLLTMEYHKFWSHVIFHPSCMDMLMSFIQEANPPYMPFYEDRSVQDIYFQIIRKVFVIFSRLITNKESPSEWMSKEYLSKIIYDNFIFTIPVLWDLCLLYGSDNRIHMEKLITNIFMLQPKYTNDLELAIRFVKEVFKYVNVQVNNGYNIDGDPPNLPETFKGFSEIHRNGAIAQEKLTLEMLKDLVLHLLDTVLTIKIFIELYPKSIETFQKASFILSMVQFYDTAIPALYKKLEELVDQSSIAYTEINSYIEMIRAEFIDIFKETVAVVKNDIFDNSGNIEHHIAEYFTIMMDCLSEKLFIQDFNANYPIEEDLDLLKQAYPAIDSVKIDFIMQAIYSSLDDDSDTGSRLSNTEELVQQNGMMDEPHTTSEQADIPDSVKEESLISEVRDILPHLGDGFILKCLQHYGFNSQRVIDSVLEGNLTDNLQLLDQSLPLIPEDALDKQFLDTGIDRLNIFDGDEFDIMTRDDVDLSRIHIGKRKAEHKDIKEVINDKSHVNELRDVYSKYSLVAEDAAMYSDEYDDTYDDDGTVAALDDGNLDDVRRPLVQPRILRQMEGRQSSEDESEEETPEPIKTDEGPIRNRDDFCMNPEILRARREANRKVKGRPGAQPPKNVDVVGKSRGQGQEKDVLVNRDRKNANKSSRGNHNRRSGAQWKRSQGMMPS